MTSKLITEGRSVEDFISDSWSGRTPDPAGWQQQAQRWGIWGQTTMVFSQRQPQGASSCLMQPHCRLWESKLLKKSQESVLVACKVLVIHPITFWKTGFHDNRIFTLPDGIQFPCLSTFFKHWSFAENITLISWGTTASLNLAKYEDEWHDGFKALTSDQLSQQHMVHVTDWDMRDCRRSEHTRQSARAGDNFSSLVRLLNLKLLLRKT